MKKGSLTYQENRELFMYTGLKHLHTYMPYLILPLLLIAIVVFFAKRAGKGNFGGGDKKLALFTMIFTHLQFVVGLVLYFLSPKVNLQSSELMSNEQLRFYGVEHISVMIIAVVLITVGYSRAKRKEAARAKFQNLGIFFLLGLLLMLSRIPWDVWPSFL